MFKSVFYHVMNWIFYTLILSFLPIIISLILAPTYPYDFTVSNLANCYLATCVLSIGLLKDNSEIEHPINRVIRDAMILDCILSTAMFTRLLDQQGKDGTLSSDEIKYLGFIANALLAPTLIVGLGTQIYMGRRLFLLRGKES